MASIPSNSSIPDDEIPVLLTIFNRPDKTRAVMENLRQIKPKWLYIAADGPRCDFPQDIEKCRLARLEATIVDWPCEIKTRFLDDNIGCDPSVSSAINWFFQNIEYGIIIEDDCIVHPHFFAFCGELFVRYSDDERIMQISSLSPYAARENPYDYHFSRMFRCSGGWGTWRRAWKHFSSDMRRYSDKEALAILKAYYPNHSKCLNEYRQFQKFKMGSLNYWDFQWNMACIAQNGLSIVPEGNMMVNIGFDEESTHTQHMHPIFENLQTQPLRFPLLHPPFVYADSQPESSLEKRIYSSLPVKSRCMYLLRQALGVFSYIRETMLCDMGESGADIKITFGMIVFNGEPFVKYNLSAVYPFAHQIIVVEGACLSSASVAGPDGHSTDGTLETLYCFKRELDPDNKVIIITAGDKGYVDGFWPEKDEMSEAYADRATGNYLWQLDSDEFYHEEQMERLMNLLHLKRPDMVSFPMITFWGSPEYIVDGFFLIRDKHDQIPRLFAWGPGYTYATHRPATVLDELGIDLRKKNWLRASDLKRLQIYMYHYSLVFPHQVFSKVRYYKDRLNSSIDTWENSVYIRLEKPFRAHNVYKHIGWLEHFTDENPAAIRSMMADIRNQSVEVAQRDCTDVDTLLAKRHYKIATALLRTSAHILAVQPFYLFYRAYEAISRRVINLSGVKLKEYRTVLKRLIT